MSVNPKAAIFSIEGLKLSANERALFREANPFGFILFARNCETPDQILSLCAELREVVERSDCPILIDQEGGRVQRLKPPTWTQYPPMKTFGGMAQTQGISAAKDALRSMIAQQSAELLSVGVNANCAPVLDVLAPETHDVIGDRAFSDDPEIVAALGACVCDAMFEASVQPVMKHIPGHGRGAVDSHHDLPVVDAALDDLRAQDFAPFKAVASRPNGQRVWAMMAHIIYSAIDPDDVATCSARVIDDVIRKEIGFDGLLMGDDVDMKALDRYGDITRRAQLSLEAGCDLVLYCAGRFDDMVKLSDAVGEMSAKAQKSLHYAA